MENVHAAVLDLINKIRKEITPGCELQWRDIEHLQTNEQINWSEIKIARDAQVRGDANWKRTYLKELAGLKGKHGGDRTGMCVG